MADKRQGDVDVTSTQSMLDWFDRLNPRNWTLAWKLVVVGLVPALLALGLGVLRVADQAGEATELGRGTRLLEAQEQVNGAAEALRQERNEATLFVAAERSGDRGVLDTAFARTDAEIAEMRSSLGSAGELDATTVVARQQLDGQLAELTELRGSVTGTPALGTDQVIGGYTALVAQVDGLDRGLLRQVRTPGWSGLTDALTSVVGATEALAVQHTVLGAAIRSGALQPGDPELVADTDRAIRSAQFEYATALTDEQLQRFGDFTADAANSQRESVKAAILATPAGQRIAVDVTEWDTAYNGSRSSADRSSGLIRQELVALSTAAEDQAGNLAGINSVILMLGLLAGITIAVLVARSLIRSLRVLRTSALDVAERRLPQAVENMRSGATPDVTVDPVPLRGRDEVVQVARAFDAVHGQAVRLAADQAALQSNVSAMFVNLSRRSQALVERQLQLIEQLESNEQDPDQLSNLFQLDHLATRMRRNSENLLVLAGTDLAKRNVAAVPMVDVLRAAVSEVEQYQRIVVQSPPTATIAGRAASDLVHLLAELLDNATNFSPPDSQVVMSTTRASDGSIVVEIVDRGVSMSEDELADANQRLGGPSTVDVSASRRMGLFVVGRLATRHGVGVRLGTSSPGSAGSGLTASVTVPSYLIPSGEPADVSRPGDASRVAAEVARGGGAPQPAAAIGVDRSGPHALATGGPDAPGTPTDPAPSDTPAAANGAPKSLPTRRPGSTLQPDGPPLTPDGPDPAERPVAEPADGGSEEAREVAARARRDQEAARRNAAQRKKEADAGMPPADESHDSALHRHGSPRNGVPPAAPTPSGGPNGAGGQQPGTSAGPGSEAPAPSRPDGENGAGHADGPGTESVEVGPAPADPSAGAQAVRSAEDRADNRADNRAEDRPASDGQVAGDAGRTPADDDATGGRTAPGDTATDDRARDETAPDLNGDGDRDADGGPAAAGETGPGAAPPTTPLGVVGRPSLPRRGLRGRPDRQTPASGPLPFAASPGQWPPPRAERAGLGARLAGAPDDGLFAPSVPVVAESDGASVDPMDAGESTPIFAEIASAWFRSNRKIPVEYEAGESRPAEDEGVPDRPSAAAPTAGSPPSKKPARSERVAAQAEEPGAAPAEHEFGTEADKGWRAVSGVLADRSDDLTPAGLPKRRPRARLVPGSAGSAVLAEDVTPSRNAENVRGRLASYQQGVRQGRESRARGRAESAPEAEGGTEPAHAGGNHDEESS